MLYIYSEILIKDLKINFCELHLFIPVSFLSVVEITLCVHVYTKNLLISVNNSHCSPQFQRIITKYCITSTLKYYDLQIFKKSDPNQIVYQTIIFLSSNIYFYLLLGNPEILVPCIRYLNDVNII